MSSTLNKFTGSPNKYNLEPKVKNRVTLEKHNKIEYKLIIFTKSCKLKASPSRITFHGTTKQERNYPQIIQVNCGSITCRDKEPGEPVNKIPINLNYRDIQTH